MIQTVVDFRSGLGLLLFGSGVVRLFFEVFDLNNESKSHGNLFLKIVFCLLLFLFADLVMLLF